MDVFCDSCEKYADIDLKSVAYGGFNGPHCPNCYAQIEVDQRRFAELILDELEKMEDRFSVLENRTVTVVNLGS